MDFKDNHSKGCKACQKGKWLCIYLTYLCNAPCSFCPAPLRNKDVIRSALGNNPEEILHYLNQYPFEGLSFSGGECFLVFDRMLNWLKLFKDNKPELYYWAYTNGIQLNCEQLQKLNEAGLDELRFNIAAAGYNNAGVLKNLGYAKKIIGHVAVEIPSIPEDYERLVQVLPVINDLGIEYLNLHEFILVPNDPNSHKAPKSQFIMNYNIKMEYHQNSQANTERIMDYCKNKNFALKINSCMLLKKEHQMLGRRKTMGKLFKNNHERITKEGLLETVYIPETEALNIKEILEDYHNMNSSCFIHPDQYNKNTGNAYLLTILPKLEIRTIPKVYNVEKL